MAIPPSQYSPQDEKYDQECLERVQMLLAKGCAYMGVPGALDATLVSNNGGVRIVAARHVSLRDATNALEALVKAGLDYAENRMICNPRHEADGSTIFQFMNDMIICAYAFGTPLHERTHAQAARASQKPTERGK